MGELLRQNIQFMAYNSFNQKSVSYLCVLVPYIFSLHYGLSIMQGTKMSGM